jgi:hypothetical protein
MNIRQSAITIILSLGVGYGVGRYILPAKIITETKEVIKEVEVTKKDVITTIKEDKRPDGSIHKETIITDRTTIDKESKKEFQQLQLIINKKPQWKANLLGGYDFQERTPQYGLGIEKRYMGPLFLGFNGIVDSKMTFKEFYLIASWEF